jgi:hypothetical protein
MSRAFLTGCDSNHEWMLEWFMKHYRKHNNTPIVFVDFGISENMRGDLALMGFSDVITVPTQQSKGWFYKPAALQQCTQHYDEVFWIDTDIHVQGDMSPVFNYLEDNKLCMCEDRGWSARRGEKWHNSGLVGVRGNPKILQDWVNNCRSAKQVGDQEVLHEMVRESPMQRMLAISDCPTKYNHLRLDVLDGRGGEIVGMHWTGFKGKLQIEKIIYNDH